jgi:hypothetical protein
MSEIVETDELSDDDIMRFTQGTRKRLVGELIKEGLPEDKDGIEVLLHAMADMDRTALGNKRIGANEKQSAADIMVATAIAQISSQFGQQNPFEGNSEKILPTYDQKRLPPANAVPGETDIGLSEENYDNLVKQFDN